jgi:hypothetical protein
MHTSRAERQNRFSACCCIASTHCVPPMDPSLRPCVFVRYTKINRGCSFNLSLTLSRALTVESKKNAAFSTPCLRKVTQLVTSRLLSRSLASWIIERRVICIRVPFALGPIAAPPHFGARRQHFVAQIPRLRRETLMSPWNWAFPRSATEFDSCGNSHGEICRQWVVDWHKWRVQLEAQHKVFRRRVRAV